MKPRGLLFVLLVSSFSVLITTVTAEPQPVPPQIKVPKPRDEEPQVEAIQEVTEEAEEKNKTESVVLTGDPKLDYIHDPNLPHELQGYDLSDYPFYQRVPEEPKTNFTCDDKFDGFYASIPHKCQVYHNCLFGIRYDFLCANYTAFDQRNLICHYVNAVDCAGSARYYDRNEHLYIDPTTTTTTTAAPQVKVIYVERPRKRRPGGGKRRPRPPADDYYYDDYYYDDEPAPKTQSQQKADPLYDDYYYYDEVSSTTTTTTTTAKPLLRRFMRPRPEGRPQRTGPIAGRRRTPSKVRGAQQRETEVEEIFPDYDFVDDPPPPHSKRQQIRNPSIAQTQNNERLQSRPMKKRRRRKKTTTTTTTAAPEEYEYEYYYDYYDDEPSSTTTTRRPIRRKKGRRINKPRTVPSAEERKKALLKAKNRNPNFPSMIQSSNFDEAVRNRIPVEPQEVDLPPNAAASPAEEQFQQTNREPVADRLEVEEPFNPSTSPDERHLPEDSVFKNSDRVIVERPRVPPKQISLGSGRIRGQRARL